MTPVVWISPHSDIKYLNSLEGVSYFSSAEESPRTDERSKSSQKVIQWPNTHKSNLIADVFVLFFLEYALLL